MGLDKNVHRWSEPYFLYRLYQYDVLICVLRVYSVKRDCIARIISGVLGDGKRAELQDGGDTNAQKLC